MSQVIDTTQMYLRTIYELLEEGVPPRRARIAERMGHSTPTVSETVARMARDGLLSVGGGRQILLSNCGLRLATQVMRRHRLAECLLVDVIGLEWAKAHDEACKWEHVMSEAVESKITDLLADPGESVYGTPIPRAREVPEVSIARFRRGADPLMTFLVPESTVTVRLMRIGEFLQRDPVALEFLNRIGLQPGVEFAASCSPECVTVSSPTHECRLDPAWADQLFAARVPAE